MRSGEGGECVPLGWILRVVEMLTFKGSDQGCVKEFPYPHWGPRSGWRSDTCRENFPMPPTSSPSPGNHPEAFAEPWELNKWGGVETSTFHPYRHQHGPLFFRNTRLGWEEAPILNWDWGLDYQWDRHYNFWNEPETEGDQNNHMTCLNFIQGQSKIQPHQINLKEQSEVKLRLLSDFSPWVMLFNGTLILPSTVTQHACILHLPLDCKLSEGRAQGMLICILPPQPSKEPCMYTVSHRAIWFSAWGQGRWQHD